ncbi:hypothetical protein KKG29_01110 [Patescibacteria group bacterium]|nr:hypothetical protein [Patescibacteria group bacterium]MBU3999763.1 hypothetical protein [Patescibacteria group bacterium]MBU4057163.1 hypothetical protein [Patescibacteria group bacterium]MBU4368499.1 hypothetical protein [Patescibacteria group bacterium]
MPIKEEELYTILIFLGLVAIFIAPAVVLAILGKSPWEYLVAISIFVLIGTIFWDSEAVLR